MTSLRVPVTDELKRELEYAGRALNHVSLAERTGLDYNDLKQYERVTDALACLTGALTSAISAVTLFSREAFGEHFTLETQGLLVDVLFEAASYLQNTASVLLDEDQLSRYVNDNTDAALVLLQELEELARTAVQSSARA